MIEEEVVVVEEVLEVEEVVVPEMEQVLADLNAPVTNLEQLLSAGVHFGHYTRKWNPKMKKYIFGARQGIYIINLVETLKAAEYAYGKLKDVISEGGEVLFVGTKESYRDLLKEEAEKAGVFYVNSRWLGGTLTNFETIRKSIDKLIQLESYELYGYPRENTKKENSLLKKEYDKKLIILSGIKSMNKLPKALFVVDPDEDNIAVKEAKILNIPVFALVSTNTDPEIVDYPIPANNDGKASVALLIKLFADAVKEGKNSGELSLEVAHRPAKKVTTMEEIAASADQILRKKKEEARRKQREKAMKERENFKRRPFVKRYERKPESEVKEETTIKEEGE